MKDKQREAIVEAKNDPLHVSRAISKYMSELGKRGGKALLEKYGREHFAKIRASKPNLKVRDVESTESKQD